MQNISNQLIARAIEKFDIKYVPKKIIICTHLKRSVVELIDSLNPIIDQILLYPVEYSVDKAQLVEVKKLGVKVITSESEVRKELKDTDCIIEDGARISKIIYKDKLKLKDKFFSVEQTSGGVRLHRQYKNPYPVINVAFSSIKLDIENRRATPESIIQTTLKQVDISFGGKEVLVIGFGSIGEGLARYLRMLGANVSIYDTSDKKLLFAKHRAYRTLSNNSLHSSLGNYDAIFMATDRYDGDNLGIEEFLLLKNGALIINAGSGTGELDQKVLNEGLFEHHNATFEVEPDEDNLVVKISKADQKKSICILGGGYPLNLHIGKGTSHDVIEVVMTMMALAVFDGYPESDDLICDLSPKIEDFVAKLLLAEMEDNSVEPILVDFKDKEKLEKPYGDIVPFHNEINDFAHFSVVKARFEYGSKTKGHYHKRSQEAYFGLTGSAKIVMWHKDGQKLKKEVIITKDKYVFIPQNYFHDVVVTSKEDFECLVIASPPFMIWDQFFKANDEQ